MDECFGFLITAGNIRFLVRPGETVDAAVQADVLFVSPHRRQGYYEELLSIVAPRIVVPIHWDDFFRSLYKPLRPIFKPPGVGSGSLGRVALDVFVRIVNRFGPETMVILPEILQSYDLTSHFANEEDH
jgi:hypothetical protein